MADIALVNTCGFIQSAKEENFKDAIACFKRALVIEKENYLLWYNLGITYRDAGDLRKAKDSLHIQGNFMIVQKLRMSNHSAQSTF